MSENLNQSFKEGFIKSAAVSSNTLAKAMLNRAKQYGYKGSVSQLTKDIKRQIARGRYGKSKGAVKNDVHKELVESMQIMRPNKLRGLKPPEMRMAKKRPLKKVRRKGRNK